MITALTYLAASLAAIAFVLHISPNPVVAASLCIALIPLMSVLPMLSRDTADLVTVLNALTDLIRGRPSS